MKTIIIQKDFFFSDKRYAYTQIILVNDGIELAFNRYNKTLENSEYKLSLAEKESERLNTKAKLEKELAKRAKRAAISKQAKQTQNLISSRISK